MNDNTLTFLTPTPDNLDGEVVENACVDGACVLPLQPQSADVPSSAEPVKTTETERTP